MLGIARTRVWGDIEKGRAGNARIVRVRVNDGDAMQRPDYNRAAHASSTDDKVAPTRHVLAPLRDIPRFRLAYEP